MIEQAFVNGGGNFNAGRQQRALLQANGFEAHVRTHVIALEPGHPYLRLPIQFATALRARIEQIVSRPEFEELMQQAETEIAAPQRWGTTFTLVQSWGSAA